MTSMAQTRAQMLKEMIDSDDIETSSSPWTLSVVLVKKKEDTTRFSVDYGLLNDEEG